MSRAAWRWWPRTLFARLTLILFCGLALAHALSFKLVVYERTQAGTTMMIGYLEQDIAGAVALIERLPAAQRADWLPHLARSNYRFQLDAGVAGPAADSARAERVLAALGRTLGAHRQLEQQPGLRADRQREHHVHRQARWPGTCHQRPDHGTQ